MFAFASSADDHELAASGTVWRSGDRIRRIGPNRLMRSIFLLRTPRRQSCCGKLLSIATLGNKAALQRRDLLVEQVVRLVDKADHSVGDDRRISRTEPARVLFPVIRRISPIGLIGRLSSHPDGAHCARSRVVFAPLAVTALAQKVLVVEQQLIETRSCDIHQAQFRLTRCGRCPTTLGDVLPPTACRLDHLIVGARAFVDKAIAKRQPWCRR